MVFAHVTAGNVDAVGTPPDAVRVGTRWYDLRKRDAPTLALAGWYLVVEPARPADTATHIATFAYTFNAGTVTRVWTLRPKTAEELTDATEAANASTIDTNLAADLVTLQTIIDTANGAFTLNTLAAAVKDIARTDRRQIRRVIGKLDGTT